MKHKDKCDWYRTWTVGNGGISNDEGYIRMRRGMKKDYYEDIVRYHIGEVPEGVRSFNWSRVKRIPKIDLEYMISSRQSNIRELRDELTELKGMMK